MKLFLILICALLACPAYAQTHEETQQALQQWWQHNGPLPDLIAKQAGQNRPIGPPLSHVKTVYSPVYGNYIIDEFQTLREAIWSREASNLTINQPWLRNTIMEPRPAMQMAWTHLLNGGELRAGDFTALHGMLLSAMQPNTYALAKYWQWLFDHCIVKPDGACPVPGS